MMRLVLQLQHRPRNHNGEWIEIEEGEAVRVDSRRGKRIRVVVHGQEPVPDCLVRLDGGSGCGRLNVLLRDFRIPGDRPTRQIEGSFEKTDSAGFRPILFLDCVLNSQGDRHRLRVLLFSREDPSEIIGEAETISFKAHDSGWVYRPIGTRKKRPEISVSKWKFRSRSQKVSGENLVQDPPEVSQPVCLKTEILCEDVLAFIRSLAENPTPDLQDQDLDPCQLYLCL